MIYLIGTANGALVNINETNIEYLRVLGLVVNATEFLLQNVSNGRVYVK